jgi:hypothetical protein
LPEPTRYELSAESDNRVATLEDQVASLTRKGAEAGEFGCYPCLCDSSRCICICISHLILPPCFLFPVTNLQRQQPTASPTTKRRLETSKRAKTLAPTRLLTLSLYTHSLPLRLHSVATLRLLLLASSAS